MKKQLLICTLFSGLIGAAQADPAADLSAAAAKLAAAKNYSWSSSSAWGEREARVTTGKTGSGGHTHLTIPMRDNSVEVLARKDKAAIKTEDGWQLASADVEGDENRRLRFVARMATNFEAPTQRVTELIEKAGDLKAEEGTYSATLSEEAATDLLSFPAAEVVVRMVKIANLPPISDAAGTVKFMIKDGILSKYELTLSGKMTFNDQERDLSRTTTVEFSKVGSTSFDIPEEAAGLLAE